MNIYIASYAYRNCTDFKITRLNNGWQLFVDGHVLQTQRGETKHYKTIEAIIKDIEKITKRSIDGINLNIFSDAQPLLF